jgi:hypothetical protein
VTTMIVLVDLKEGVRLEDYERWVLETYAPAARRLPSVQNWRNYRIDGLLTSDIAPPYQYIVILDTDDLEQLGRDMARRFRRFCPSFTGSPRSPSSCRSGSSRISRVLDEEV